MLNRRTSRSKGHIYGSPGTAIVLVRESIAKKAVSIACDGALTCYGAIA